MAPILECSKDYDLKLQRALIFESGLFNETLYVHQVGEECRNDPVGHYLSRGWRAGATPNPTFPGFFVLPLLGEIVPDQPPMITWLEWRSAGWVSPDNEEELKRWVAKIRDANLFDPLFYSAQLEREIASMDPLVHYLLYGERRGLLPSAIFDPAYYGERYPDVVMSGVNRLLHFAEKGQAEGRFPRPLSPMRPGRIPYDRTKENVILAMHDTSRSGASILGWNIATHLASKYNLFVVTLSEGELAAEFEALSVEVHGPFVGERRNPTDIEHALRPLLQARRYRYAIVNSVAGHLLVEPCARHLIPTVVLVHEFASYFDGDPSLIIALDSATEIVFPAHLVRQAAEEAISNLRSRRLHVLPQGRLMVPAKKPHRVDSVLPDSLKSHIERNKASGHILVLGIGTVAVRKGTDLFLAVAASVFRRKPDAPIRFLWVGDGYRPQQDFNYSIFLQEQIRRSDLEGRVTLMSSVGNTGPLYEAANIFLLPSRLDPLPDVSIDAAFHGMPVVCFKNASGMAELMLSSPETSVGVVDYLDVDAAAAVLLNLSQDAVSRSNLGGAMRRLAWRAFDMGSYVEKLDAVGGTAQKRMAQCLADAETLCSDPTFDQNMFLGPSPIVETRKESVVRYLTRGGQCGWTALPIFNYRRRPAPGFNPRTYASVHSYEEENIEPLADFVRRGRPGGPWQLEVLRPPDALEVSLPPATCRVAIHAHLFYPDLCSDLVRRLKSNQTACDLIVTTDTAAKRVQLQDILRNYAFARAEVRVVPNRGRDIGPLLTALGSDLLGYDLIGHVHGKRSTDLSGTVRGDEWREFLWQNLIGDLHPMFDRIVAAFAQSCDLGLVFPSDPNTFGWDENRANAKILAERMGWRSPLPDGFDFPAGTMFWARPEALRPLLELGLTWDDYPPEPVAGDGTILHALERLVPFASTLAGFRSAVTYVPGVSWWCF